MAGKPAPVHCPGRIAWGEEPGTRPISIPHRYRRFLSVSPAIVRVWPHPSRRSLERYTAPQSQIRLLAYKGYPSELQTSLIEPDHERAPSELHACPVGVAQALTLGRWRTATSSGAPHAQGAERVVTSRSPAGCLSNHRSHDLLGSGEHLCLDCWVAVRAHSHVLLAVRPFNADDGSRRLDLALAGRVFNGLHLFGQQPCRELALASVGAPCFALTWIRG